jgi:hypothetical protein
MSAVGDAVLLNNVELNKSAEFFKTTEVSVWTANECYWGDAEAIGSDWGKVDEMADWVTDWLTEWMQQERTPTSPSPHSLRPIDPKADALLP